MSNPTAFVQMEDPHDNQWIKFQVTRHSYFDEELIHEEDINFWALRVSDGIDIIYYWNRLGSLPNINNITYKYINVSYWFRSPSTVKHVQVETNQDKYIRDILCL